jgi:hypothetical protein
MPTKPKRSPSQPSTDGATQPIELVVKRGAIWRFNTLKRKTAELPVNVVWDRRQSDRRDASQEMEGERRGADRRQKPPFTWDVADFVVVGQAPASVTEATADPADPADAPPPPTKKKPTGRSRKA